MIIAVGTGAIQLSFSVDNSVEVWADGTSVGTLGGWHNPRTVTIGDNTGILSFQASNSGGPAAFLASLDNGMVSNSDWRCTTSVSGTSKFWHTNNDF